MTILCDLLAYNGSESTLKPVNVRRENTYESGGVINYINTEPNFSQKSLSRNSQCFLNSLPCRPHVMHSEFYMIRNLPISTNVITTSERVGLLLAVCSQLAFAQRPTSVISAK